MCAAGGTCAAATAAGSRCSVRPMWDGSNTAGDAVSDTLFRPYNQSTNVSVSCRGTHPVLPMPSGLAWTLVANDGVAVGSAALRNVSVLCTLKCDTQARTSERQSVARGPWRNVHPCCCQMW